MLKIMWEYFNHLPILKDLPLNIDRLSNYFDFKNNYYKNDGA